MAPCLSVDLGRHSPSLAEHADVPPSSTNLNQLYYGDNLEEMERLDRENRLIMPKRPGARRISTDCLTWPSANATVPHEASGND